MITNVRIFRTKKEGNTKGFASCALRLEGGGLFYVTGISIMGGKNGLFISMPSKKVKDDWKDVCFPGDKETRKAIQDAILEEYSKGEEKPAADIPF